MSAEGNADVGGDWCSRFPQGKKNLGVRGRKPLKNLRQRGVWRRCCCMGDCREPLCFGRTSGSHLACKVAKLCAMTWWVIMEIVDGRGADGRRWCLIRHGRGFFHLGGRWSTSEINQSGVLTRDTRGRLSGRNKSYRLHLLPSCVIFFFSFFNNWIFSKPPWGNKTGHYGPNIFFKNSTNASIPGLSVFIKDPRQETDWELTAASSCLL